MATGARTVTVLAWNIRQGGGPSRTAPIALLLAQSGADIVVLSEFRARRGSQLRATLADAGLEHQLVAPGEPEEHCVFVASRLPLELRPAPAPVHSACPARWLNAAVRLKAGSLELLGLHVPDESEPTARLVFLRGVVEHARAWRNIPSLLLGDWNASRRGVDLPRIGQTGETFLGELASQGFEDLWRRFHPGERAASWVGPRGEKTRIDTALGSRLLAAAAESACYIETCAWEELSDHAPLVVTFGGSARPAAGAVREAGQGGSGNLYRPPGGGTDNSPAFFDGFCVT